jgi:hypothetical protein
MKRLIGWGVAVVLVLLLVGPVPCEAGGHFFFNFTIPLGVGPWWGPAYPYYPYPYYAAPPVVVRQSPPAYVQPPTPPQQPAYWYYCPDSRTYYPYVKECTSGWLTVVPPSTAPPSAPMP